MRSPYVAKESFERMPMFWLAVSGVANGVCTLSWNVNTWKDLVPSVNNLEPVLHPMTVLSGCHSENTQWP